MVAVIVAVIVVVMAITVVVLEPLIVVAVIAVIVAVVYATVVAAQRRWPSLQASFSCSLPTRLQHCHQPKHGNVCACGVVTGGRMCGITRIPTRVTSLSSVFTKGQQGIANRLMLES
jgi:hypothetical protein